VKLLIAAAVFATAQSTLPTGGKDIRQYAFDGDPKTAFASKGNATKADNFTLTFDAPVTLKSATVLTGSMDGKPQDVVLEVSTDGKAFKSLGDAKGQKVTAVRVRPAADLDQPLVVREFTIDSEPKVTPFKNPVEFTLDVKEAPEMKEWGEKAIAICERAYPMLCRELASDNYTPPTQIRMTLNHDYKGVAQAAGTRILGSAKYFTDHPKDFGAMVHETAHSVQGYNYRGNPGWLVEGVADYVRYHKFEPQNARKVNANRAQYNGSYGTSAAFLNYVATKYDKDAVNKLNALMRTGKYTPEAWRTITGKPVEELNQEWRASLAK
jgi:hypothetical protein